MNESWDEIWISIASKVSVLRGDSSNPEYREVVKCLEDCFVRWFRSQGRPELEAESLAVDVAANVSIQIYEFEVRHGDSSQHGMNSFRGWCFAIARNYLVDHLRFKKKGGPQIPVGDDGKTLVECVAPEPGDWQSLPKETIKAISVCVEMMKPHYRQVLLRHIVDEWDHARIAEEVGVSVEYSRKLLERAKEEFRKFAECDGDIMKVLPPMPD